MAQDQARFLKYRYFARLERPLIICEGKTDDIYLNAIRSLPALHSELGAFDGKIFESSVEFFNYAGSLELTPSAIKIYGNML